MPWAWRPREKWRKFFRWPSSPPKPRPLIQNYWTSTNQSSMSTRDWKLIKVWKAFCFCQTFWKKGLKSLYAPRRHKLSHKKFDQKPFFQKFQMCRLGTNTYLPPFWETSTKIMELEVVHTLPSSAGLGVASKKHLTGVQRVSKIFWDFQGAQSSTLLAHFGVT